MTFSYGAVWDDTLALLRAHGRLLAPVAGVFVFLPAALIAVIFPEPQPSDPGRLFAAIFEHYASIWHWLFLSGLFAMVGGAAMLRLVLARETSVGGAIAFGATLLPFYFLVSLIGGLIIGFGLLALLVPGLYLLGRLTPATAILVAENRRNPIEVIGRSFEITKERGWAVFGLVFVIMIVGTIVTGLAGAVAGIFFFLVAGQELGMTLAALLGALLNSAFSVLLLILDAAIYRALTPGSVGATFE